MHPPSRGTACWTNEINFNVVVSCVFSRLRVFWSGFGKMSSESKISVLRGDVAAEAGSKTVFKVLLAISFCHLLNDTVQSLLPAIYPLLRDTFHLDFGQI